ncbi:Transient Receptor Potential Cation Channel Subfamily M Member 8 [Manis pentadactyla]|nr:Transient Receptor Potential Cation Channel Subfamily M Member 8 [Manis pentadactyla]
MVHCEEQLVEAACHALGGNSSSKPCSELSEDHRPGFPESLQLSAQLDWILSNSMKTASFVLRVISSWLCYN